MEIISQTDVEAPQDFVFGAVADFNSFERQALRRGIDVSRLSDPGPVDTGARWRVKFEYRGRKWDVESHIAAFDRPGGYRILSASDGMDLETTVDLLALSRNVTRMTVTLKPRARTVVNRVFLQSLKLVRGRVQEKMDGFARRFADSVEKDHRKKG